MLNSFLFEKFYLHYALCDFDSIVRHCTKLFIFDVTFEKKTIEKSCLRPWTCALKGKESQINQIITQFFFSKNIK